MPNPLIISSLLEVGKNLIDRLFPDKTAQASDRVKAELALVALQQDGTFKELSIQMSAIIAEAQSADPWTSRARPGFLWLFYVLVAFLIIVAPMIGVFFPEHMDKFFVNVAAGFVAIPEPMWWTFTTGYLGYVGARQYGKTKGTDK